MIAVTLQFFLYICRGFSGSKSKFDCIAISKVWTTGMLVAAEDAPDKHAGTLPHQSSYSQLAMQSLGPLYPTEAL